jgi:hypothetical protein
VEVYLKGPPGTLSGPQLPLELDLEDWSGVADISFYDFWMYDISDSRIEASIFSLKPIQFETIPGDFDADGDADDRDYAIWRNLFGNSQVNDYAIDADASGNGEIDASDYVVWRRAVNSTVEAAGSIERPTVAVPEPAMSPWITLILAALQRQRRIHANANPISN